MRSENVSVTEFVNGRLRIDYVSGCVYLDDEKLHLTPIEYKLLCLLAKNVGKVLTHKYIIQSVWGTPADNSEASLRVFMATDTYRHWVSYDEIIAFRELYRQDTFIC